MTDTIRTLDQILALLADNTNGDISPQDLRDQTVTLNSFIVAAGTFDTRAELVTWAASNTPVNGQAYRAGILSFIGVTSSTVISDILGMEPSSDWTPEHFGDTTTSNCTAIVDSASAAAAAAGVPLWFEPRAYRGSFKAQTGGVWFGVVGKTKLQLHAAAGSAENACYYNVDAADGILTNFLASGIIFEGPNETGFLTYGFQDIQFEDCMFINAQTYGFGAQSRPGSSRTESQDGLTMTRCGFENNGTSPTTFDGCDVKYATNMVFTDCWSTGNSDSGFNLRGQATINGLRSWGNGTDNVLLQATDLEAGHTSKFTISGLESGATTVSGAPSFRVQASTLNDTHIVMDGQVTGGGKGIEISGAGKVYGSIKALVYGSVGVGVDVTGDYIGAMNWDLTLASNAGGGFTNSGKNSVIHMVCNGNTGDDYAEAGSASNNYLLPTSYAPTVGARVGSETAGGAMSVRGNAEVAMFPSAVTGFDITAASTTVTKQTRGTAGSIGWVFGTKGNGTFQIATQNGTRTIFSANVVGSAVVNYAELMASTTGSAVRYRALGTDTNIDLMLEPKGSTGRVWIGAHSAIGAETVTGYITVKDSGGTERKLAVVS